jgi:metacaspase-1
MARGVAVHIGLNRLHPDAYAGWDGALDACENDALSMRDITASLGYETQVLLSEDATATAVLDAVHETAKSLTAGDICVLTYAGHGGQFQDLGTDESDSLDETWLLFDREVLDDEINTALAAFDDGVRAVVLSDSCHSGTVVRKLGDRNVRARGAPPVIQQAVLAGRRDLYEAIRARTPSRDDVTVDSSVILISGCQDDQSSMEVNGHGVFTAAVLEQWNGGAFVGDYAALHQAVLRSMPPSQTPNLLTIGTRWVEFERQIPFTVEPPGSASPGPDNGDGVSVPGVPRPLYRIKVTLEASSFDSADPLGAAVLGALTTVAAGRDSRTRRRRDS